MTPLARVALFAFLVAVWAGIAALWIFVHPAVAVVAVGGSLASIVAATLEVSGSATSSEVEKPEAGDDFKIRRRDRDDIERDARRAAAADDVAS